MCNTSTPNCYNLLANQLVDSFEGFTSIDDLRRHLKLMLKTIQHTLNQLPVKEATEEAELLSCFKTKLFEKVREQFPLLFKQQEHITDHL
jgi:thioredoxin-like negative regulator of GroEL